MKGCDALRALECGAVLTSSLGTIRWNARRSCMELLFDGSLPVPVCDDQWSKVGLDITALYRYDWIEEEEE